MANYPGSQPNLTNPAFGASRANDYVIIGEAFDEIEAIAAELGTDPAGTHATVKDRFDALSLDALTDVVLFTPSQGQGLVYTTAFGWVAGDGVPVHEAKATAATHQAAGLPQMYYNGTLRTTAPKISAQNSAPSSPTTGDWWMDTT